MYVHGLSTRTGRQLPRPCAPTENFARPIKYLDGVKSTYAMERFSQPVMRADGGPVPLAQAEEARRTEPGAA